MRTLCLMGLLIGAPVFCQQAAPAAPADTFVTAGAQYTSKSAPYAHYSGWGAMAVPVGSAAGGLYSFSGAYASAQSGKFVTSYTSGLAQRARTIGPVSIFVLGAIGVSQTTTAVAAPAPTLALSTTSVGLALNSGLLAVYPVGKTKRMSVDILAQAVKNAGFVVGVGVGWHGK